MQSDRAMRESGFETSFQSGPFSGPTDQYAQVWLDSLLYKHEKDMAHFASLLGRSLEVSAWERKSAARKTAIDRYLWDASQGIYLDHHFITTFYPLWAGVASHEQAATIHDYLALFERSGGLATSDHASGMQWDHPFGWAPTNWHGVFGLDGYGYHEDAARIACGFCKTIRDNFLRDGAIRAKYNVADGSANVEVAAGYTSNVVGFGWTNTVSIELENLLAGSQAISPRSQHRFQIVLEETPRSFSSVFRR
jgi:alpha,alpha-trehalase